jgi:basic amino acid/polyamine antiporter, APA family
MAELSKGAKIGLWTTTALVVGNMIGSGVFSLPASLAAFGGISLLGWIGSSVGAIILALMFSKLSKMVRGSIGGPYAYTRAGFGDFAAFVVAWGYWISIWVTNAAIAVAFVSYLTVFFPILKEEVELAVLTGMGAIWLLTWINTRGIKKAGLVQNITVVLKIVPLLAVTLFGLFYVDFNNFKPFNMSEFSDFGAITATTTLTLFAFLGLESATIPSGNIDQPERTIPRATMIGTLVTMVIYILGSFVVMGMIPPAKLATSLAPFADAAVIMWGPSAAYWVAAGAIISTFGALNGWILLQGQMPMAAARDKLFPGVFGKENKKGVPAIGVVISSVLVTVMLVMNFNKGLAKMYEFMVLLTTFTVLIAYIFSAASYGILLLSEKQWKQKRMGQLLLAIAAFAFSLWAIMGSGEATVYWGFVAVVAGVPFYVWMKRS